MARIIPRITRSGGSNSDARQSATAPPPPPPKKTVFVIDDDSDDDDDTEEEEEGGDVEVQHRVNVRNQWPSELQKDRQSNGDSSSETSSGSRSESSVRFVSDQETGSDSIEISEEERDEECGSKSSPEPSVRLVELDSSDDEEGETSNCCSVIGKSKSLEIPEEVRVKEEEEVDENEVKPMAKLLPFCVARRTRAQVGKLNRVSYSEYFKEKFSDDSEDEEDTEDEESEKDKSYNYAEKSASVSVLGGSSENNGVFVKKKKLGIDILVSGSNEGGDSEGVNSSSRSEGVSQRTRSRFNSVADPKMKKMGTVRNPVCLDVDELQSEEDEMEDEGIGMDLDRGKGKWVCNRNKGGSGMNAKVGNGVRDGNRTKMQDTDISKGLVERKRKLVDSDTAGRMGTQVSNMMESERKEGSNGINLNVDAREKNETDGVPASTSKKRKRVRPPNANELFKILTNNIFNEEGTTLEELFRQEPPVEDNSAAYQENLLPLVFSFGDDDVKPVEKAEHEKELDDLWADFDFTMEANNIGVYHDDEV